SARPNERSIRSRPALSAASAVSYATTSHPLRAQTSAIPEPISPMPTTPTRVIDSLMAFPSFRDHSPDGTARPPARQHRPRPDRLEASRLCGRAHRRGMGAASRVDRMRVAIVAGPGDTPVPMVQQLVAEGLGVRCLVAEPVPAEQIRAAGAEPVPLELATTTAS